MLAGFAWSSASTAASSADHAKAEPESQTGCATVGAAPCATERTGPVRAQAQPPRHDESKDAARVVTLAPIAVHGNVLAATLDAQQRLTPGALNIVNTATFDQRSVTNMSDALRYVPGVSMASDSGGSSGILSIRGSNLTALNYDNSGVTLLQDGLPVSSADGANHNRLLDPATARAIVVASGPNAIAWGASDLGGAIDFISRTARNSDPRQVDLSGGSYDLGDLRVSTGGIAGNVDGMVTVEGKHFGGWQDHSREDRTSLFGNTGWQVSDALNLRFFGTYIDSRQQLAGSITRAEFDANPRQADPSYVLGNHQLDVKTARGAAIGDWKINADSHLEFGVSYEVQSLYHPIVDVFDFATNPPTQLFSLLIDTTQRTSGAMARYHLKIGDHQLLVGINVAHTSDAGGNFENHGGARGPRTDDVNQHANNVTLFLLDRWAFAPDWTLVYGTQALVTNRDVIDDSLVFDSVRQQRATYKSINPRIGLIRQLGPHNEVFASASRIYEAPNNFELDNDVRQNDATLLPTEGTSYEIGARGTGATFGPAVWRWSLSLYYAQIRNEVLSVEDPTEPGNMLATNYPRTTHAGIEALLAPSFAIAGDADRIEPLLSLSWNRFNFHDDPVFGNNRLPYAPRYTLHGQIMLRNVASGFYAGPTFDLAGARYADMANSYRVGGYAIFGLRAGIERKRWTLYVEARNLANRKFINEVSVLTQADPDARVLVPGAPRSVFAGFKLGY